MCKNFVSFPGTRLGRLARAKSRKEILKYCDKYFPPEDTEVGVPEFFFDHSWIGFNSILDVYRYSFCLIFKMLLLPNLIQRVFVHLFGA